MSNNDNRNMTTYKDAFLGELGLSGEKTLQRARGLIKELEKEGHAEQGICYAIGKGKDKILSFKNDKRFFSVLRNEIRKHSWPKGDPRWKKYWENRQCYSRREAFGG